MSNKKRPPKGSPKHTNKHNQNSAASQRRRLVAWLKEHGSITTLEARSILDILSPAARAFELRGMDYPIDAVWVDGYTDQGLKHRIARYVLRSELHE